MTCLALPPSLVSFVIYMLHLLPSLVTGLNCDKLFLWKLILKRNAHEYIRIYPSLFSEG